MSRLREASELTTREIEEILRGFPGLQYQKVHAEYNEGRSSALVYLVGFKQLDISLQGNQYCTLVVKIDHFRWIQQAQRSYLLMAENSLQDFTAHLVNITPTDIHGFGAAAYRLAFDRVLEPLSLRDLIVNDAYEDEVPDHINQILAKLIDWNADIINTGLKLSVPSMIWTMLGNRKVKRILPRLAAKFNGFNGLDIDAQYIIVEGGSGGQLPSVLPNPAAFFRAKTWDHLATNVPGRSALIPLPCPSGRVHGDLNTGNVMCLPYRNRHKDIVCPNLIDCTELLPFGMPLFDFAYLELDALLQTHPFQTEKDRQRWLTLLEHVTNDIAVGASDTAPAYLAPFLKLIAPIRRAAQITITSIGASTAQSDISSDYEVAWWAAIVAAGLDFSTKRDIDPYFRTAAYLYASYGLRKIISLLRLTNANRPTGLSQVDWISKNTIIDSENERLIVKRRSSTSLHLIYQQTLDHSRPHRQTRAAFLRLRKILSDEQVSVMHCGNRDLRCSCQLSKLSRITVILTQRPVEELLDFLRSLHVRRPKIHILMPLGVQRASTSRTEPWENRTVYYSDDRQQSAGIIPGPLVDFTSFHVIGYLNDLESNYLAARTLRWASAG